MDDSRKVSSRKATTETDSALSLRVDQLADNSVESSRTLYCTDIEETELRVAIQDTSNSPVWEMGEWDRFDGVRRSENLDTELRVHPENGAIKWIDAPEMRSFPSPSEIDNPELIQMNASVETIAVTVQPRIADKATDIRIEEPASFEIGAVCFTQCNQSGDQRVYHCENPEPRDERLLLEHVVEDFSEIDGAILVTHDTDYSPIEILHRRLTAAADGEIIDSKATHVLDDCFHANIDRIAGRSGSDTAITAAQKREIAIDPVSLDRDDIGIDPADWRENWERMPDTVSSVSDPRMFDQDYPTLVERYLGATDGSVDSTVLAQCLKADASADLGSTCEFVTDGMMNQVGCPRIAGRVPQHS